MMTSAKRPANANKRRHIDVPEITVVVFRKWRDRGDIIALFPELPATNDGDLCDSYQHVGQHGSAGYYGVIRATRRATPDEYASLYRELTRIGYRLRPVLRATYQMHQTCRETARQSRLPKEPHVIR